MKTKSLVTSSLIFTIGTMLIQGLNFITLPIYTRMMDQVSFGEYSLFASWMTVISVFIGFSTSGSLPVARLKYESDYDQYSAHALTVSNITFLFIAILCWLASPWVVQVTGFSQETVTILLLQSFFTYVIYYFGTYFIQYQKTTASLILSASTALSSVGLSIYFLTVMESSFWARVWGLFIPYAIGTVVTEFYIYRKGKILFRKDFLKFSLIISFPLIFHGLGNQILNQLDRVMIDKFMTKTDVALYSFGYSLGLIIQVVLMALNTAWIPWYFEAKKKDMLGLNKVIQSYLVVGLYLTLGYLSIFPEVTMIMGRLDYGSSKLFIPMIVLSYFFSFLYTFPVNIQFYQANTKFIPIGTVFAAVVNFIANWVLIPRMGIMGAAVATVLSYLALLVLHHMVTKRLYDYKDVSVRQYVILSMIATGYTILMTYLIPYTVVRFALIIIITGLLAFYFRQDIVQFLKTRKKG